MLEAKPSLVDSSQSAVRRNFHCRTRGVNEVLTAPPAGFLEARLTVPLTLAVAFAAALLAALFGWLGARKPEPMRGPRLAPYRFLMLLCAAVVLIMIVHLVNLAGIHTGRQGP